MCEVLEAGTEVLAFVKAKRSNTSGMSPASEGMPGPGERIILSLAATRRMSMWSLRMTSILAPAASTAWQRL